MDLDCESFDAVAYELQQGLGGPRLHGAIVGGLCGRFPVDAAWAPRFAAALGLDPEEIPWWGESFREALALTTAALQDEELGFEPVLPDEDDTDLVDRALALAEWCDGFVLAYAAARDAGGRLSDEAGELLADLQAIADGLDGESMADASDEDESDYMHLVEFVRIAALTIFAERGGNAATVH